MTRRLAAAMVVLALSLPAPPAGQAVPYPSRIVSLVPPVTQMIFAIGAGARVAGVGTFDREPPEVARLPRVGGLLNPNTESILALRPDLVIVYEAQQELKQRLTQAQVPFYSYAHKDLANVMATLRSLGARLGNRRDRRAGSRRNRRPVAGNRRARAGPAAAGSAPGVWSGREFAPRDLRERRVRIPTRHGRGRRRARRLRRCENARTCRPRRN